MTFGEKVQCLRKHKKMSRKELADQMGVTVRTINGWELQSHYPKKRGIYNKLAAIFDCDVNFLLIEERTDESFEAQIANMYNEQAMTQARAILMQAKKQFASDLLSLQDKLQFINDIQTIFVDSLEKARRQSGVE